MVLSTNIDTMESGCKKVLEKYVRKTRELVHIIVGGKEIVSTPDHPYYVAGRGFVNAHQLCIGTLLLDADGKVLEAEQIYKEQLGKNEEVTVYNFQVEDWHTYHVGEMKMLVHNAEYESGSNTNKLFKNQALLDEHYGKHGQEIADVLGDSNYSIDKYLDDANYIINNGTYVPELNGYVSFMSGKKYGFVGLDRTTGDITTFHIKNISELIKKAPSLGFER